MKKSVIVNFFKWWFSIHPSNIAVSEDWLNLEKRLKEKKHSGDMSRTFCRRF